MAVEFQETDSAGSVVATYLSTENRLDVVKPTTDGSSIKQLWQYLLAVFLPVGYPHSVTPDYIKYQIYDSLQAFSSSIAGLLSSRAVLEGVGVGDASASPTAAILLSILQDSTGRLATILFAHRLGSALEPECKMWRLAADVFNDAAMILDCCSPALPKGPRVVLLSVSSSLRALCGVAAGSAKASLSAHFARWGNLGEVNAKDSSQETVISLVGMMAGSLVVGYITSPAATWSCLILLLSIHLAMNHAAVRAVSMHTLNRQRANLVFSHLYTPSGPASAASKQVVTPEQVSVRERIFERDGALRWKGGPVMAWGQIGASLQDLASTLGQQHKLTASTKAASIGITTVLDIFKDEAYLLWYSPAQKRVVIVLKEGCTARLQLKAWAHALYLVHTFRQGENEKVQTTLLDTVKGTLNYLNVEFPWTEQIEELEEAGWDVDAASLETVSGTRLQVNNHGSSISARK